MARKDIKEGIVNALISASITSILGEITDDNYRIYDGWPQHHPLLVIEPPHTGGWLVIDDQIEDGDADNIHEVHNIDFHIMVPIFTLAEDAIDIIDSIYQWNFPQQRDVIYENFILYNSRRVSTKQGWHQDYKLHQKTATYTMDFVKNPTNAG